MIARALVALLLCIAFLDPSWWSAAAPIDVFVLVDESASIDEAFVNASWLEVSAALAALPAGSTYSLIRFGRNSAIEIEAMPTDDLSVGGPLPRRHAIGSAGSNIAAALRMVADFVDVSREQSVVLLTDGIATNGNVSAQLSHLRSLGLQRILVLHPGQANPSIGGARLHQIKLPDRVAAGSSIPLLALLSNDRDEPVVLEVSSGDTVLARHELRLAGLPEAWTRVDLLPDYALADHLREVTVAVTLSADSVNEDNTLVDVVNVDRRARLLYLSPDRTQASIADELADGGWQVERVEPARFGQALAQTNAHLVIIDNIAIGDLPGQTWQALNDEVSRRGTSLLVLGGHRAFGAGGYRHSLFESALPVTAQSREPMPEAAIEFVIDKSGSMDAASGEVSRFDYARQAVLETLRLLQPSDQFGIVAFDAGVAHWLDLDAYTDPPAAVRDAWHGAPSGGTRLAPAVAAAAERLVQAQAAQKIMAVITDGFANESDASIREHLDGTDIDVIAIAVGDAPDLDFLRRLASGPRDLLLGVRDTAQLPRLVNEAVGRKRYAHEHVSVDAVVAQPMPFSTGFRVAEHLPEITSYLVTKERTDSAVYLRTEQGDPLLASHHFGLGRVVALPAGLGHSVSQWRSTDWWGSFLGGLVQWSSGLDAQARVSVRVRTRQEDDTAMIEVNEVGAADDWQTAGDMQVRVVRPSGEVVQLAPSRTAPGYLVTEMPLVEAGLYRVSAAASDASTVHAFHHNPIGEFERQASHLDDWLADGLVENWQSASPLRLTRPVSMQQMLLLACLAIYLVALLVERLQINMTAPLEKWFGGANLRRSKYDVYS